MKTVRIVPAPNSEGGVHKTQGTEVLMPDGQPIPGITRIVLVAEPNDVWRAEIHCLASVEELRAAGVLSLVGSTSRDDEVEVTCLHDTHRVFARGLQVQRAP